MFWKRSDYGLVFRSLSLVWDLKPSVGVVQSSQCSRRHDKIIVLYRVPANRKIVNSMHNPSQGDLSARTNVVDRFLSRKSGRSENKFLLRVLKIVDELLDPEQRLLGAAVSPLPVSPLKIGFHSSNPFEGNGRWDKSRLLPFSLRSYCYSTITGPTGNRQSIIPGANIKKVVRPHQ